MSRRVLSFVPPSLSLFAFRNPNYCCPHRVSEVVINGTAPAPVVVGTATLNDGPFGLGLRLVVDASILLLNHVMTVSMKWSRPNTTLLEGSVVVSSAVVRSGLPTVFSSYNLLPQWGLNSTAGWDLLFTINDNGALSPSSFQQQWSQALTPTNYFAYFPARVIV